MLLRVLIGGALLGGAPLLGHAQFVLLPPEEVPAPAPSYRFYAGVGAYASAAAPWGSRDGQPATHPLQASVGYRPCPRLALQVSAVSAARSGLAPGLGVPAAYADRSTALSAQARYALPAPAARPLQIEAVGGLTWSRYAYDGANASYVGTGQYQGYVDHTREAYFSYTGGASVRYRFHPRAEAVADATLNASTRAVRHVLPAVAVGVRYDFDRR